MKKSFILALTAGSLLCVGGAAAWAEKADKKPDTQEQFIACYQKADWKCAGEVITAGLQKNPEKPALWVLQAELFRVTGPQEKALESYNRALELAPNDKGILAQRASLLVGFAGRQQEGLEAYRQMYEMNPEGFEENLNLGATLVYFKKYEEAITYLAKAVEINPAHTMAKVNLATAYQGTGKYPMETDKLWMEIAKESPDAYEKFGKKAG